VLSAGTSPNGVNDVLDASRDYRDRLLRVYYQSSTTADVRPGRSGDTGANEPFASVFATHEGLTPGTPASMFGPAAINPTGNRHAITVQDPTNTSDIALVYARASDGALMLWSDRAVALRAVIEASPRLGTVAR
jgi:hypothetical protein